MTPTTTTTEYKGFRLTPELTREGDTRIRIEYPERGFFRFCNTSAEALDAVDQESKRMARHERQRKIEKRIVRKYLKALVDAGYALEVDDGGDFDEIHPATTNVTEALENVWAVDDAHVFTVKQGKSRGWLYFVMGNAPYEVLNDYTVNLEEVLAPVNEYAEQFA
jgi:hypothetical protein